MCICVVVASVFHFLAVNGGWSIAGYEESGCCCGLACNAALLEGLEGSDQRKPHPQKCIVSCSTATEGETVSVTKNGNGAAKKF